jgi:hypothetical protein
MNGARVYSRIYGLSTFIRSRNLLKFSYKCWHWHRTLNAMKNLCNTMPAYEGDMKKDTTTEEERIKRKKCSQYVK